MNRIKIPISPENVTEEDDDDVESWSNQALTQADDKYLKSVKDVNLIEEGLRQHYVIKK